MQNKLIKFKKATACILLSALLASEMTSPVTAEIISENAIAADAIGTQTYSNVVSDNQVAYTETELPDASGNEDADKLTNDVNPVSDFSEKEIDLSVETMAEGQSIKANFYEKTVSGQLIPFTDSTTGQPILTDIIITRTDGSAYLCDSFTDEDTAIYSEKNPTNPAPWLRIMPVRRGYQVTKWINTKSRNEYYAHTDENDFKNKGLYDEVDFSSLKQDVSFEAKYNSAPYVFKIQYHLQDGVLDSRTPKDALPDFFKVTSDDIVLPNLVKPGYRFLGWYLDEACTIPTTGIPKGTYIDSDAYGFVDDYHLYTKWEPLALSRCVFKKVSYTKKGTMKITYKKITGADGYEICFSNKKNFSKNINTFDVGKKTSYTITNLVKGNYYVKVRAYAYDSTGTKIYGNYSKYKLCKVKNGVKEYDAKTTSLKMKSAAVTKDNQVIVQASAPKRIKSSDYSYYLVRTNAQTGKFDGNEANVVSSLPKMKTLKFTLKLMPDTKASILEGCYAVAIKTEKGYTLVSPTILISNPEAAATYTAAFPKTMTPSKKGIQGAGGTSNLGVQHFFFNMDITKMLSSAADPNAICYTYNQKTYYFNLTDYAKTIKIANAQGLVVTGQIGITWPENSKKYLISSGARTAGHEYYSLNFTQSKARDELEALFACMAENFSTEDCHLDNWILGNEVNMHQDWYYAGKTTREKFMANYTDAFRGLYYAVKASSKNAKVYICLDHNWAGDDDTWGAKPFMDAFNASIKAYNSNINWNLAYHLYPQNLANAATWKDSLATNKTNTKYVTPKNLEVLTKYVKKKFGSKTRIILSEQGFTSNGGTAVQAAGIAYTFYKAQFNTMIDAIIFHRYQDDPTELNGSQPLNYGICNSVGQPKADSYNVFKFMDSPAYAQYVDPYLKVIGVSSWKQVTSKFNPSKLVNIP